MTDVRDPDNDFLRRALATEAEGVSTDEAFAARVTSAVARDARRHRRRSGVLALAAVLGVVAGLAALLGRGPTDEVRTDGPPADTPPPDGAAAGRPDLVVLIDRDGRLVAADLETGEDRVLYDEVSAPPTKGDFIGGIDVSPDGEWAYFTVLTDTAGQTAYRVPTAGGDPEVVGSGADVQASPDGRWLALSSGEVVTVVPADGSGALGGGPVASTRGPVVGLGGAVSLMRWSADSRSLAYTVEQGDAATVARVIAVRTGGGTVALGEPETVADPAQPGVTAGMIVAWSPEGEPVVMGPALTAYRDLAQDASAQWLLWVDTRGTLRAQEWGSREVVTVKDVPLALAADW
jgi:hypothetical protein